MKPTKTEARNFFSSSEFWLALGLPQINSRVGMLITFRISNKWGLDAARITLWESREQSSSLTKVRSVN